MNRKRISVFRTDAGPNIGGGHVMRCLSLAQVLREEGWVCVFMIRKTGPKMQQTLASSGHKVCLLSCKVDDEVIEMQKLLPNGCDLLIIDHYEREKDFETACRPWARNILAFDDTPGRHHDCDGLLDQTMGREANDYHGFLPPTCHHLLGSDFTLLREEYEEYRNWPRQTPEKASHLLVTFGSGDPENQTLKTLYAVQGLEMNVRVVVGSENLISNKISDLVSSLSEVEIFHDPNNMAELMAWADLAISASGSTCWELAFMGLPSILIVCAENQKTIAERLDSISVAKSLGWHSKITEKMICLAIRELRDDPMERRAMSSRGRHLIDGNGALRVANFIGKTYGEH